MRTTISPDLSDPRAPLSYAFLFPPTKGLFALNVPFRDKSALAKSLSGIVNLPERLIECPCPVFLPGWAMIPSVLRGLRGSATVGADICHLQELSLFCPSPRASSEDSREGLSFFALSLLQPLVIKPVML